MYKEQTTSSESESDPKKRQQLQVTLDEGSTVAILACAFRNLTICWSSAPINKAVPTVPQELKQQSSLQGYWSKTKTKNIDKCLSIYNIYK